ncbi:hypothetical protein ACFQU2_19815 [Siccirubricoccus deserti]
MLRVPPRLAVPLAVALHELAINAARHGALSVPEGQVAVRWRLEPEQQNQPAMLRLSWKESGGPPVRVPMRRGFGTRLLEGGLGRDQAAACTSGFIRRAWSATLPRHCGRRPRRQRRREPRLPKSAGLDSIARTGRHVRVTQPDRAPM